MPSAMIWITLIPFLLARFKLFELTLEGINRLLELVKLLGHLFPF